MSNTQFISFISTILLFCTSKCDDEPSVIIVGAGSAGIAAATKLLENNITNIVVLEAEGRIGGRIYSVEFGEAMVDLGAQFCYGKEGNIVYELVKDFDLLGPGKLIMTVYHSSSYYGNETLIKDQEFYKLFYDIYEEGKKGSEEISLGDYMMKRYNDSVVPRFKDDPQKLKFVSEFLHFFLRHMSAQAGGFSAFDESVKSDFVEDKDENALNWKGRGFKTILDVLMKKLPNRKSQLPIDKKIHLNKTVTKVVWDNNTADLQKATVECSDGSVYNADHVIFTPSLGVLKENYKTLFYPSLPEKKINAIEDLGVGASVKVFLHFPVNWWPRSNFTDFTFVWTEKDMQMLPSEFPDGPIEDGKSWLMDLLTVSAVVGNPQVLVAFFYGEFVPKIELCSDDLLIDGIMFVLNKLVGRHFDNITQPDAVLHYNWYSSLHFRGGSSFQTVKARTKKVSAEMVLSEPLTASNGKQTLLFAGDATHPIYFSTVHGAIETGHREAHRIIDFYK